MKSVLIVVRAIPMFDLNAGDHRNYLIIRSLAKHCRVYVLPLHGKRGEEKYRDAIEKLGVSVLSLAPQGSCAAFNSLIRKHGIDTVLFEFFWTAYPYIYFVPDTVKTVIDSHDLHYIKYRRRAAINHDKELMKLAALSKKYEMMTYRSADAVIAVNATEGGILKKKVKGTRIDVIPMCVEDIPPYAGITGRSGMMFHGYFSNPPNSDAMRYFADAIYPVINKEMPGVKLDVYGKGSKELPFFKNRGSITVNGYTRDIRRQLQKHKVFVCPLRHGAGTKKKILDALINGLPVVTTSVGAEGLDLVHGRDILITDKPRDFARHVVALNRDERLWERISVNGYTKVRKNHHAGILEAAITEVVQ